MLNNYSRESAGGSPTSFRTVRGQDKRIKEVDEDSAALDQIAKSPFSKIAHGASAATGGPERSTPIPGSNVRHPVLSGEQTERCGSGGIGSHPPARGRQPRRSSARAPHRSHG